MSADSKLNNENFINKSKNFYPGRFSYEKTFCETGRIKVTITCNKHGDFQVLPQNHLRDRHGKNGRFSSAGCSECRLENSRYKKRSNRKRKFRTSDEFVLECKEIWGDRFDYSQVDYKDCYTQNSIICKSHGAFKRNSVDFLFRKRHCPSCQKEELLAQKKARAQDRAKEFIKKAKEIHKSKYSYELESLSNLSENVLITCPDHGKYYQEASKHLEGKQCRPCAVKAGGIASRLTNNEFIEKAQALHGDKFDYSITKYTSMQDFIKIICPCHGVVELLAKYHLNLSGCTYCITTNSPVSKVSQKWLDAIGIVNREVSLNGGKFKADGFDPKENMVYEFYGCFFHGCPRCFKKDTMNTKVGLKMQTLHERTKRREKALEKLGYQVTTIWECDWNAAVV